MIVKILPLVAGFGAVRYNTNKAENDKGELMKVSGFGPLHAYSKVRPQDYVNYLEMISSKNTRIEYPQFHAVLSAKGRTVDKHKLTETAEAWLREMGYEQQPYMIMFHKDRQNNHVHIVSTRVDKNGKKISSAYERIRSQTAIKKVLGQDEYHTARQDLAKVLAYKFSTKAQFMLLLEELGYTVREKDKNFKLIKYGKELHQLETSVIKEKLKNYQPDSARAVQLTALLHKFRKQHNPVLKEVNQPVPEGSPIRKGANYSSDLVDFMRDTFGLKLIFHGEKGRPAYGYTIIDHAEGNVFKGGEVMDIAELLLDVALEEAQEMPMKILGDDAIRTYTEPFEEDIRSVNPFGNYEDAEQPLKSQIFILEDEPEWSPDKSSSDLQISISDDVDDESIHGMRRRRKQKARTNLR